MLKMQFFFIFRIFYIFDAENRHPNMRKKVVFIVLLLGMVLTSTGQNRQLQIMSYNVRHCVTNWVSWLAVQVTIRSLGLPSNSTAACMVWASSLARCHYAPNAFPYQAKSLVYYW